MVEVRYQNRLGNRLFQYCIGRILAEGLGYAPAAGPVEGFPGTAAMVGGWRYERPAYLYRGHRLPIESILLDRAPRRMPGHLIRRLTRSAGASADWWRLGASESIPVGASPFRSRRDDLRAAVRQWTRR